MAEEIQYPNAYQGTFVTGNGESAFDENALNQTIATDVPANPRPATGQRRKATNELQQDTSPKRPRVENGPADGENESRANDTTAVADGNNEQPADQTQAVDRRVQALQAQAGQPPREYSDDEADFVAACGPDGLRRLGMNPNFGAIGASEVKAGDIIIVWCYDRAINKVAIRDAQETIRKARYEYSTEKKYWDVIKHEDMMFFDEERLADGTLPEAPPGAPPSKEIIYHTRPVIEKARFHVIVRRTQGTVICLPFYTHGDKGLNNKRPFEVPDFVNVIDERADPVLRAKKRWNTNLGIYDPLVLTEMTTRDPFKTTSCVKLSHPYAFAYGIQMKRIGKMAPESFRRLKQYAMLRAFALNLADIGPPTNDAAEYISDVERLKRNRRHNPELTGDQIKDLYHGEHSEHRAQFERWFGQEWTTIDGSERNSDGGLGAIVEAVVAQHPHTTELHMTQAELRTVATSRPGFRWPAHGYSLPADQLSNILIAWATRYAIQRPVRLGIYIEGKGPVLFRQYTPPPPPRYRRQREPPSLKTIWIYCNNIDDIFERMGRKPAHNSGDHSKYWAIEENEECRQNAAHVADMTAKWKAIVEPEALPALLNTVRDDTALRLVPEQTRLGPDPLQNAQALVTSLNDPQAWADNPTAIVQQATELTFDLCLQLSERMRARFAARIGTTAPAAAIQGNATNNQAPAAPVQGNVAANQGNAAGQGQAAGVTDLNFAAQGLDVNSDL
jgi:hypothetical protein